MAEKSKSKQLEKQDPQTTVEEMTKSNATGKSYAQMRENLKNQRQQLVQRIRQDEVSVHNIDGALALLDKLDGKDNQEDVPNESTSKTPDER